jgi:hypothetical protein
VVAETGLTWIRHVYGLRGIAPAAAEGGTGAEHVLALGYYSIHTQGPRTSGLKVLDPIALSSSQITFTGGGDDPAHLEPTVEAQIWVDSLGHGQLHFVVGTRGDVTELAAHLRDWCGRRRAMRVQGLTLPEWVGERVEACPEGVDWDQDVLQVVALPEQLATPLSKEMSAGACEDVTRLVYRNPDSDYVAQSGRLKTPSELNHELGELAAHGRGVVVLGGHDPDRVATLTFIAAQLLFALGRVRGIRMEVEQQLRDMRVDAADTSHWLDAGEITTLSETVRQMRIRLAVDVEAFADGIYMPEIVLDDFRRSYAAALDLGAVVESTSTMLDSLAEVAEAYRAEAQLLLAGQRQELQRRWQRLATIAAAVAIPLTLVFAFFGVSSNVNAPSDTSIFDMAFYWPVWAVAALSVVAIFLFTYRTSRPTVLETKN